MIDPAQASIEITGQDRRWQFETFRGSAKTDFQKSSSIKPFNSRPKAYYPPPKHVIFPVRDQPSTQSTEYAFG